MVDRRAGRGSKIIGAEAFSKSAARGPTTYEYSLPHRGIHTYFNVRARRALPHFSLFFILYSFYLAHPRISSSVFTPWASIHVPISAVMRVQAFGSKKFAVPT